MHRIIIDTNIILYCIKFKIDIFNELRRICNFNFKVYVIDKTLDELSRIAGTGKLKDKEAARLAKLLIENKVNILKTIGRKHVDNLILDMSDKSTDYVATQDKELKQKLKARRIPVIVVRQKKYLSMAT